MELYILRHGVATPHSGAGADDSKRPLTKEGRAKMKKEAKAMAKMELSFGAIISSPALRASQTADIIVKTLKGSPAVKFSDHLAIGGSHTALLKELMGKRSAATSALLVGHEPGLSMFIAELIGGEGAAVTMKKGGLAKVTVSGGNPKYKGSLEWLLTPGILRRMA